MAGKMDFRLHCFRAMADEEVLGDGNFCDHVVCVGGLGKGALAAIATG